YWTDDKEERILLGTGDAYLIALDAKTGQPCPDFGDKGRVDLTKGLFRKVDRKQYAVTSPPVVCRDVVVVGSSINDLPNTRETPPAAVRGCAARSGKHLGTFNPGPKRGDSDNATGLKDRGRTPENTTAGAQMSAEEKVGYVSLPIGTPTNDWYGGHRHGDNL